MRGKALNVVVFDSNGKRYGKYRTAKECSKALGIHSSSVYRLVKSGDPLKRARTRNGMTFDSEEEDDDM